MKRTVILGAGFGGLAAAEELRRSLGRDHDLVLLDRREHFLAGLRKLWELVGIGSMREGIRSREGLNDRGWPFLREEVRSLDPATRSVETEARTLDADFLVIALGAETRADLVPGAADHAHNLYDRDAIPALAQALRSLDRGRVGIVIAGGPYKCPPAPYECALLLDEHLRETGRRDRIDLSVRTFQPMLLPNAGRAGSEWLAERLAARNVDVACGCPVERVEAGRVVFRDGDTLEADVLMIVPPHRPPEVVVRCGLAPDGGWVSVDPGTMRTGFAGVFAVGDVIHIPLANGLPLPKAGLFAERQGRHAAAEIVAEVRGEEAPPPFDGQGYCYLEMGRGSAAHITGDFFHRPEPEIRLGEPSGEHARAKHRFEAERLERWFGG